MSADFTKRETATAGLRSVQQALRTAERQVALARQTHDLAAPHVRELSRHAKELAWGPGGRRSWWTPRRPRSGAWP